MIHDTELGGPSAAFPRTRHSAIRDAASADTEVRKRGFEELIAAYWKPVYKYIRVKWSASNEDAKDLTQEFFARALENGFVEHFDPERASFRTYVRVAIDGLVANARKAAGRIKRGGLVALLPLDFDGAEEELRISTNASAGKPDDFLHREWVRSLLELAIDDLRRDCDACGKTAPFRMFERYDLEGPDALKCPTYSDLALEFGLPVTQVTNHLASMRRQFRRHLLQRIRSTTATREEFLETCRELLGEAVE